MKQNILTNHCLTIAAHDQAVVKCSIDTASRGGISKILATTADCKIMSVEALDRQAVIAGKVAYKIIYSDKDNVPQGLDYFCEFDHKIDSDTITPDMTLKANGSVVDLSTSINGDEITLMAVCDMILYSIKNVEINAQDVADEKYYCLKEEVELVRLNNIPETVFELESKQPSDGKVDKVLLFDQVVSITETLSDGSISTVRGLVVIDIVYLDDGSIKSRRINIPFQEQIEGALCDVQADVKSSRLVLGGDNDNTTFEIELFIAIGGRSVESEKVEVLKDVFSLDRELECQKGSLPCRKYIKDISVETTVSAASTGDRLPEDSQIFSDSIARVIIADLIPGDDKATIEGLVTSNVIYSTQGVIRSVEVELPFSVDVKASGVTANDHLEAKAIVKGLNAELDQTVLKITADVLVRLSVYRAYTVSWLSKCSEGEEKSRSPYGISVYYIRPNMTKWEIAKSLNIDPNSFELEDEGEDKLRKIAVFRPRND